MMNRRQFLCSVPAAACSALLLSGCGTTAAVSADTSLCGAEVSSLEIPQGVKIVGLGEASHGVSEYHKLKAEVFQTLVENNGCRTFVIEGDFGGCLKVEAYIHGGSGTAEDAVGEIGFAIYRTQELADLVDWMRAYNETAADGQDLHFYGMDMQRYDNNKAYLFEVLDTADAELSKKYQATFAALTDDGRISLGQDALEQAQKDADALLTEMDARAAELGEKAGEQALAFARECAYSIRECSELTASGNDYNTLRDGHMKEKVDWILQQGDGSLVFINGHNGHIEKVSPLGYACLGSLLNASYQDAYFAIATDAADTTFNSQTDDGFAVMEVKNSNGFTAQLTPLGKDFYYIDFLSAMADEGWQTILKKAQPMTALNVGISAWQQHLALFYIQTLTPADAFDGAYIFQKVTPTTLLDAK